MKQLILLSLLPLLFFNVSAQTKFFVNDTTIYGSIQNNYKDGQAAYNKYITENAHYPDIALKNNIMGTAYVQFTIGKDSILSNIKTYSGIGSGMDEEAVRLIKQSGKWFPSMIDGNNIKTRCIVPINYILMAGENNVLKGVVNGEVKNSTFLSNSISLESSGLPLSEVENYIDKPIKFIGKIYGTKKISDTMFVLTCGELTHPSMYVNIALMGTDAQVDIPKEKLSGMLIRGIGKAMKINGTPVIIITDRKQYAIIDPPNNNKKLIIK